MGHTTQPGSRAPNKARWQTVGLVCRGFKLPLNQRVLLFTLQKSEQAQWTAEGERYLGPV